MAEKKDKTFGFRVTDEKNEKYEAAFQASGFSSKDEWFESLYNKDRLDSIKDTNQEYKEDIAELEVHTSRINELVGNMLNRSVYLKADAVRELQAKLDSKESIIMDLQKNVGLLKADVEDSENKVKELTTEKEKLIESFINDKETLNTTIVALEKSLNETKTTAERDRNDKQALIDEWKEKNENLASIAAKYQNFEQENEAIKAEQADLLSQINNLNQSLLEQQDLSEKLKNEKQQLAVNHIAEIDKIKSDNDANVERLINQKEMEKREEILTTRQEHQEELAKIRDMYIDKITELYARLDTEREKSVAESKNTDEKKDKKGKA